MKRKKVKDIYKVLDEIAPFNTAMDFDNVGLLLGDANEQVHGVLVTLDVTAEVVAEALENRANLIISHHPVIFKPLKSCLKQDVPYLAIKSGVNVICAHTNFDFAKDGVCKCLADVLEIKNLQPLSYYMKNGKALPLGLVGEIDREMASREFAVYVKARLNCQGLRYTESSRPIKRVAVCSGGAGEYIFDAIKRADAYVTGEIRHHEILEAARNNVTVVDAGHFNTENIAMSNLADELENCFQDIRVFKSQICTDYRRYL